MHSSPPNQQELITFARAWAPYGGGNPEEIFVTFGITPHAYFTRLAALLDSTDTKEMAQHERQALLSVCTLRLGGPTRQQIAGPVGAG
ncbi:DUF3263 domain-containing protein [Rhodococcus koreensis]|uniref:DUF3263 domain-containing protein n=1 Tax=Rhodococcus koreensis TaxID=99653 RepID=UPI00366FFC06